MPSLKQHCKYLLWLPNSCVACQRSASAPNPLSCYCYSLSVQTWCHPSHLIKQRLHYSALPIAKGGLNAVTFKHNQGKAVLGVHWIFLGKLGFSNPHARGLMPGHFSFVAKASRQYKTHVKLLQASMAFLNILVVPPWCSGIHSKPLFLLFSMHAHGTTHLKKRSNSYITKCDKKQNIKYDLF